MRAEERDRRAELIARKNAALQRWPNRADDELKAELNDVAHELMNLKHGYGCALLELAAGSNMDLATEAAARLSSALELARKHMPVGVASIKYELFRAEHTVAQLRGTHGTPALEARRAREIEEAA